MMNTTDDSGFALIKNGNMSHFQIGIVALCMLIAGLDGFDVLVVAYTAPAISAEWHLGPTQIGMLLSAGLAGMGFGALFVAPLGDWLGRRPAVIICMLILCLGMFLSAITRSVEELALMRVITGLGIGGILANINIVVSEYSSNKRRALCISLMAMGYPIGATLGGLLSVNLINDHGWRSVYIFGGCVAALILPWILWQLPESLDFLWARRPHNALKKSNKILRAMHFEVIQALPPLAPSQQKQSGKYFSALLKPEIASRTVAASAVYFCVMMTSYFLLSWMPKMLTELGLSQATGISGSLLLNIGGMIGCLLFGFLAPKLGPRRLAAAFMIGLFITAIGFSLVPATAVALLVTSVAVGFCLYTSINTLYVLVPQVFPTTLRSTGTGLAMSVGRIGAVSGPFVAGMLMAKEWSRPAYILVLALPMLVAAISLIWLRQSYTPAFSKAAVNEDEVTSVPVAAELTRH